MEEVNLNVDGTRVYGQFHPAGRGKAAALLLHGFNSSLREFGDLPERLAENGVHALAIDHRGHGLSDGEHGRVGLDRALADVQAAVAYLRERVGKRVKLALVGHSLGGAHAVGVAGRTDDFQCLVLAHPVDRIFDELDPAERVVYHALGRIGQRRMRKGRAAGLMFRPPLYRNLLVDRDARRRAKQEGLLSDKVNVANYAYALTMQASDWARRVKVPALCITSEHDRTVKPQHTLDVFEGLGGETEHLRHEGGHSCFLDLDRDRVVEATVSFVRRRLGVKA